MKIYLSNFKIISAVYDWCISCEIALKWISLDLADDKSALVQVMAWCRQATSHYPGQCWPSLCRHMASLGDDVLNSIYAVLLSIKRCCWEYVIKWKKTFSALLALCAGNSPVTTQRPLTQSSDVFIDLRLNKWLSKQSWGWWFETQLCSLWRHCNDTNNLRSRYGVSTESTLEKNNTVWHGDAYMRQWFESPLFRVNGIWHVRSPAIIRTNDDLI